ncbi:Oidioi.mRNA.OKI2018_I69.XSR.g16245.t1.cds [Oikopleura dioica]|uniref:Oidioi.mRNA.OKI2018_I69.XSR.g16245.t1.cds n=1 Tax=Oikopleura dioica TaxID=34765 RepID=A0ABN7SJQ5_OIKDI|nr:Oidioi.mRNA.OKI2018_I69.XSR.g16245.t1.cds [Oikopleura dioica]
MTILRGNSLISRARRAHSVSARSSIESIFSEQKKSRTIDILESIKVPKRMKRLKINSAVMIPLCIKDGKPSLLFTRRAFTLRSHRGEVCFPGGRLESGETTVEAALREANEEIGLDPRLVSVWGTLPGGIPDSRFKFAVQGVLVDIGSFDDLSFRKSDDEVECIFTLSLDELLESSKRTKFRFDRNSTEPSLYDYELPSYQVEPRLWGMSAMFTNFVMAIVTRGEEKYVPGRTGLKIPSFTDESDFL